MRWRRRLANQIAGNQSYPQGANWSRKDRKCVAKQKKMHTRAHTWDDVTSFRHTHRQLGDARRSAAVKFPIWLGNHIRAWAPIHLQHREAAPSTLSKVPLVCCSEPLRLCRNNQSSADPAEETVGCCFPFAPLIWGR